MVTPEVEADGQRESVNRKISVNQIVWNLRSAYTVAALDCQNPRNSAILPHYRQFLLTNAKVLKTIYDQMDHEYRDKYGRVGRVRLEQQAQQSPPAPPLPAADPSSTP